MSSEYGWIGEKNSVEFQMFLLCYSYNMRLCVAMGENNSFPIEEHKPLSNKLFMDTLQLSYV